MSKTLKMLNKKVRKDKKGFTLVELLVVIAIIGILAAVAVPTLFKNIEKSKVADLEGDYNAVKTAVLSYASDHSGTLPATYDSTKATTTGLPALTDYLDTVPAATPIGGTYAIETTGNVCKLTFTPDNPAVTDAHAIVVKLKADLGNIVTVDSGKVSIKLVD